MWRKKPRRATTTTKDVLEVMASKQAADMFPSSSLRPMGKYQKLMTGDAKINPDAAILVLTTEILRGMLQRRAAALAEMAWVVFDEVHYMHDIA